MHRSILFSAFLLYALTAYWPLAGQTIAPRSAAQMTADQIIARHIEARGGLAKIKAIQSLKSLGHINIGPMVLALSIENPRGAFRSDTSLQGMTKTEAFDGSHGWVIDPFAGKGPQAEAEPMSRDQLKQVGLQMDFDGPLVGYQAKGHRVALMGLEHVNGVEAYCLKISLKNGDELRSFIDTTTFMEIKATNKAVTQGKEVEVETRLSDYRPVDGVLLPFALEITPKGQPQGLQILLDTVEANTPMDASRFKMPARRAQPPKETPGHP